MKLRLGWGPNDGAEGMRKNIELIRTVRSNVRVDTYDWEVKRVLPIINEDINEEWISDKTRYACDGLLHQRLDTPFIKYICNS